MQNTTNSTVVAEQLSLYISSVANSNASSASQNTLSVNEIDSYLTNISGVNVTNSNTDSILVAKPPYQGNNTIVLGASFSTGVGGKVIDSSNTRSVNMLSVSAAAIVTEESLSGVASFNMVIIDKPTTYKNADNTTNKKLIRVQL